MSRRLISILVSLALVGAGAVLGCGNEGSSSGGGDQGAEREAPTPADDDEGRAESDGGEEDSAADAAETEGETEPPAEDAAEPSEPEGEGAPAVPAFSEPELHEADGLRLVELVLAPRVENRAPVDPARVYKLGRQNRVYAFIRLENPSQRETELILEWVLPDGRVRPGAKLRVPNYPRYVTWAYRGLPLEGRWAAQVKTASGSLLGRIDFEVTTDEPPATAEPEAAAVEPEVAEPPPASTGAGSAVTPVEGTTSAANGLRVKAMVVCRGVEERQPMGAATSFSIADGGRLYTHVLLENPLARATKINLTWERPDGVVLHGALLDVPARPRYVTWGFRGMPRPAGRWAALVRSQEGTVLARQEIEIAP